MYDTSITGNEKVSGDPVGCQCAACQKHGPHKSDCSVHGVDTETGIQYLDCDCGMAAWAAWAHTVIP